MLSSAQVPSAKADDHNTAPNACTAGSSRAPGAARRRVAVTNRYPHPVHSHFLVSRAGTCHTAESRSHNGQARRFQKGDHILRPRYSNCRECGERRHVAASGVVAHLDGRVKRYAWKGGDVPEPAFVGERRDVFPTSRSALGRVSPVWKKVGALGCCLDATVEGRRRPYPNPHTARFTHPTLAELSQWVVQFSIQMMSILERI